MEWGERWRDRLDEEILKASVFIPLLSANYLRSENCRAEFLRFHSAAKSLGVTELILPVLLFSAPTIFNDTSDDEIVAIARDLQWELIEEAVLSDPGSAEWKRTMARLAERFASAFQKAEEALSTIGEGPSPPKEEMGSADSPNDGPGLAELMVDLQAQIEEVTTASNELSDTITSLGAVAEQAPSLNENPSAKDIQVWSLNLARSFRTPAERLDEAGNRLFVGTKGLDATMADLRHIASEMVQYGLAEQYNSMLDELSDIHTVQGQMEELLESIRPVEYMSVAIRKALSPARRGLTKVSDSIALIRNWERLPQE